MLYRFQHIVMFNVFKNKCMIDYINDYDYYNVKMYFDDLHEHVFDLSETLFFDKCENILKTIESCIPYYVTLDTRTRKITAIRGLL